METTRGRFPFLVIYIASFLYAFHYTLPLYVASSFMGGFIDERTVGMAYALSSVLTTFFFLNTGRILRVVGNYTLTLTFIVLETVSLLLLAFLHSPLWLVLVFILNQTILNILYLNLNIFLEAYSSDATTGATRGMFLTILNIAILIAPFIAGMMFSDGEFRSIYLASAAVIAPVFLLIFFGFRGHHDPDYKHLPLWAALRQIAQSKDIQGVFAASFFLNLFYAWMIIYTPLYLYKTLGIPLSQIVGIITPIALIPFVVFQAAMGRIADRSLGEKEMLVGGFLVMAASTAVLAFVSSTSVALWAALLFVTRVGAAAVEAMSETYFFKKVDSSDAHLITLFRNIPPLAYLAGPIIATMFLSITGAGYQYLFLVLGFFMLVGVSYALTIQDTK